MTPSERRQDRQPLPPDPPSRLRLVGRADRRAAAVAVDGGYTVDHGWSRADPNPDTTPFWLRVLTIAATVVVVLLLVAVIVAQVVIAIELGGID